MAYWNNVSGIGQPIPIRTFNGLYVPDDQGFSLNEELFTELVNFNADAYPSMSTSQGYNVMLNATTKAIGMGVWKARELHIITSNGDWLKYDATNNTTTTIASGLDTSQDWTFCNFKGNFTDVNLIACNGVSPIKKYNGTTVSNLANAPVADFICTHSNRLYCTHENTIHYSGIAQAEDWSAGGDSGGGFINCDTTDGEFIIGLSPGSSNLTIFKNSSIHELFGKGPQSYQLFDVALDIGAVNNKSITYHDDVIYFMSRDGFYSYSGGLRPNKDWSINVQNIVNAMSIADPKQYCATSIEDNLYFTIIYEGRKQTINYSNKTNSFTMLDNIQPYNMTRFNDKLYIGDDRHLMVLLGNKTNNGNKINSKAVTKPFTSELIAQRQEWYKVWLVASMDQGSTISISLNTSPQGGTWIPVSTMTADKVLDYQEMLVPLHKVSNVHSVRIRIEATGYVQIHEITRQLRQLPLRR